MNKANVKLGNLIESENEVLIPIILNEKDVKIVRAVKGEDGIFAIKDDKQIVESGILVRPYVSEFKIKAQGKETVVKTVTEQSLDITYNRTLLAIKFDCENDLIDNLVDKITSGDFGSYADIEMKDISVDSSFKFVKENIKKFENMELLKHLSNKKCWDEGSSISNVVVFGKSAEWYTIKDEEISNLISKFKQ